MPKKLPTTARRGGSIEARKQRAAANREALLAAARFWFAREGYAGTSLNDIAAEAGVTRGALYSQFADKRDLFLEVFQQVLVELNEAAKNQSAGEEGLWNRVEAGYRHYLTLSSERIDYQNILLIDGPAVLGWRAWREMQAKHISPDTIRSLHLLMEASLIVPVDPEPLANLILACLHDAALSIAYSASTTQQRERIIRGFFQLIGRMRT